MPHFPKLRPRPPTSASSRRTGTPRGDGFPPGVPGRLEDLGDRVEALRTRYKPWMTGVRTTSGEHPSPLQTPFQAEVPAPPKNNSGREHGERSEPPYRPAALTMTAFTLRPGRERYKH